MRFRRYIQGHRKGKEANRIEREAMQDPFLAEALEGYDRVQDDHVSHINTLRYQIRSRNQRRLNIFRYGSLAASFLLLLGFGTYFLLQNGNAQIDLSAYDMKILMEEAPKLPPPPATITDAIAQNRNQQNQISSPSPAPLQKERQRTQSEAAPEILEIISQDEDVHVDDHALEEQSIIITEEAEAPVVATAMARSMAVDSNEVIAAEEKVADLSKTDAVAARKSVEKKTVSLMPVPVVGKKAYKEYLEKNLVKPTDDNCREAKGKVTLTFFVNQLGKPYNITISKSLCTSADQEAIRLIKEGPDWIPGDKEVKLDIKF